jgi:cell division protein FtsB
MEKKEVNKGFSREFFVILSLIILTFFFLIHEMNQIDVDQIYLDSKEIMKRNRVLKERIEIMKRRVEFLKTDEGIEAIAREKLRLVRPGEIIIMEYDKKNNNSGK